MNNGLSISEGEFLKMKSKEQNLILFRNVTEIRKSIQAYKFYYKLTSVVGGVLVIGMGILFSFHFGGI